MILRRAAAASLAVALAAGAAAAPPPAAAVTIVYTVTVLPLTAMADAVTPFTVTVTNVAGPDELGCLELTVPASYELYSVSQPVQSEGRKWSAVAEGGTVVAWSESGGGRLEILESVTFVVTARPKEAEISDWTHHAHRDQGCTDEEEIGIPVPVTVVPPQGTPDPSPTPEPTPTPKHTPGPKPRATARPTPQASGPPAEEGGPDLPNDASATPTATPSPTAQGSATPRPNPAMGNAAESQTVGAAVAPPGSGPGDDGDAPDGMRVASTGRAGTERSPMGIATLASFTTSTVFAVPAAVLGGPGLLILLWVVLQAIGTATWIPAVRRLRGRDTEAT